MKNKEISEILIKAGDNTSYLWNKPRPDWNNDDFKVLDCIRNGERYSDNDRSEYNRRYYEHKKQRLQSMNNGYKGTGMHRKHSKSVVRISDGKVYESMTDCAKDNNIHISTLSLRLSNGTSENFLIIN